MIIVIWDKMNGEAIPEGRVWNWVNAVVLYHQANPEQEYKIRIGVSTIIDAFRVCLKKEILKLEEIQFWTPVLFDDSVQEGLIQVPFNKNGRSHHWPTGFCDLTESLLEVLL